MGCVATAVVMHAGGSNLHECFSVVNLPRRCSWRAFNRVFYLVLSALIVCLHEKAYGTTQNRIYD